MKMKDYHVQVTSTTKGFTKTSLFTLTAESAHAAETYAREKMARIYPAFTFTYRVIEKINIEAI